MEIMKRRANEGGTDACSLGATSQWCRNPARGVLLGQREREGEDSNNGDTGASASVPLFWQPRAFVACPQAHSFPCPSVALACQHEKNPGNPHLSPHSWATAVSPCAPALTAPPGGAASRVRTLKKDCCGKGALGRYSNKKVDAAGIRYWLSPPHPGLRHGLLAMDATGSGEGGRLGTREAVHMQGGRQFWHVCEEGMFRILCSICTSHHAHSALVHVRLWIMAFKLVVSSPLPLPLFCCSLHKHNL
jgi:hypothetical protein